MNSNDKTKSKPATHNLYVRKILLVGLSILIMSSMALIGFNNAPKSVGASADPESISTGASTSEYGHIASVSPSQNYTAPSENDSIINPSSPQLYPVWYFVNLDIIMRGTITNVDNITIDYPSKMEGWNGELVTFDVTTQESAFVTVDVTRVYHGTFPGNKKTITLFSTCADGVGAYPKGTLVKGKEYVFFITAWDNKEERALFDLWDLDDYSLDKRSDALLWSASNSLFPVSNNIINAYLWGGEIPSSYPFTYVNRFEFLDFEHSLGFLSDKFYEEDVEFFKTIKRPEDFTAPPSGLYTEEDFIKALKILQERYPKDYVFKYGM